MKKVLVILMCAVLAVALFACKADEINDSGAGAGISSGSDSGKKGHLSSGYKINRAGSGSDSSSMNIGESSDEDMAEEMLPTEP